MVEIVIFCGGRGHRLRCVLRCSGTAQAKSAKAATVAVVVGQSSPK